MSQTFFTKTLPFPRCFFTQSTAGKIDFYEVFAATRYFKKPAAGAMDF
jgi:hypothetical protein